MLHLWCSLPPFLRVKTTAGWAGSNHQVACGRTVGHGVWGASHTTSAWQPLLMPAGIADRLSHQHAVNACLEALEAAALADCAPEQ